MDNTYITMQVDLSSTKMAMSLLEMWTTGDDMKLVRMKVQKSDTTETQKVGHRVEKEVKSVHQSGEVEAL